MTKTSATIRPVAERLLTEKEAAPLLGVSHRTLQKWRCLGSGPVFCRISGAIRYHRDDLAAFVAAGRRTSTSATSIPE